MYSGRVSHVVTLSWVLLLFTGLVLVGDRRGSAEEARAPAKIICDFETPFEIEMWEAKSGVAYPDLDHVRHGKTALGVLFSNADGCLVADCTLPRNWSGYRKLVLDLFSPEATEIDVVIADEWSGEVTRRFPLAAGGQTIVFPLEALWKRGIQLAFIKRVEIRPLPRHDKRSRLFIDHLRLTEPLKNDIDLGSREIMLLTNAERKIDTLLWIWGRAQLTRKHATEGRYALRADLRANAYISTYGVLMPDWRGFTRLRFDVTNPSPESVEIEVKIRSQELRSERRTAAGEVVKLGPGLNSVDLDLVALARKGKRVETGADGKKTETLMPVDLGQMHTFWLVNREKRPVTLYFDRMRLVAPDGEAEDAKTVSPVKDATRFRAGVSRVDISPVLPMGMAGSGSTRMATRIEHPIYARGLFLTDGETSVCIVTIDLLSIPYAGRFYREMIAEAAGVPANHVFLWSSHDHNAPVFWGSRGSTGLKYIDGLYVRMAEAAKTAANNAKEAKIGWGVGRLPLSTNRAIGSLFDRRLEEITTGRTDPRVSVLLVSDLDDRPGTALFNFCAHANYSTGYWRHAITADYPGWAVRTIKQQTGARALFCTGPQGDQDGRRIQLGAQMARRTGIALGREVVRTMRKITCERDQKIRVFTLEPYEPGTVPMSALVVGDAFYVDMPGELYMDYGLALKKESTFQITNTCFTNGPYLTTPKREGAGGASLTGGTCRALKIVEDARTLLMSAARANGKPVPVIPLEKALAGLKHPEPHERAEAARALGIRRHAASRTTVEKLLKDPDGEVRIQAAFALGKIGSISSIGPLLDLVMKEPVTADVVQVSVGRLFSEDAERTLIREIESDSPAVRAVAALALGRSKRPAKVLAPLVKALTDKSAAVRRNAALSLGKLGREEAVEALTRTLLKEKNATVLINVLAALGKLQAQGAVPEIEKLLAKKNHQVSRQAALTLLAMKRPLTLDESRLTAFAACGPVDRWLADKLKKSVQNPNRP